MVKIRVFLCIWSLAALSACGPQDRAESIMPSENSTLTCTGETIKSSFIVRFKNGQIKTFKNSIREKFKEDFVRPNLAQIDYIEYDQKISVRSAFSGYEKNPTLKTIAPFSKVTGAIDNWALEKIQAATAWQQGFYGQGVTVAVIDSGVDISHPQLAGRIKINDGESGLDSNGRDKRFNGVDDDGNDYIDDFQGYDFFNHQATFADTVAHGTHVAGIIAAEHNETRVTNTKVQGVAPMAKILPLKFIDPDGGTLSAAIEALEYARHAGVQIINASWGGPSCAQSLNDKIKDVTGDGIIFVVAAGNSGNNLDLYPEFPAAFTHPLQVTVGASGTLDGMSSFSNYSNHLVHLFAPGFDIVSTLPGNTIGKESGTSMATPFVAGALAVMRGANPSASAEDLVSDLLRSVDTNAFYQNTSHGRLNVAVAVQKASIP